MIPLSDLKWSLNDTHTCARTHILIWLLFDATINIFPFCADEFEDLEDVKTSSLSRVNAPLSSPYAEADVAFKGTLVINIISSYVSGISLVLWTSSSWSFWYQYCWFSTGITDICTHLAILYVHPIGFLRQEH